MAFILLIICFCGYCLFIGRSRSISFAFTPAVTTSLIILVMFIGGICRVLSLTAWTLYWLGLGLFLAECIIFILKRPQIHIPDVMYVCLWIIGVCILFTHMMGENYFLYHYDNFSHWGIVTRVLLKTNHIPTASDANVINFRSYPIGSAAFIYFCCKNLSLSGSNALLFSQGFAVYNFYFSLLGCIRTNRKSLRAAESILCIICIVALMNFNIPLTMLLVDNLLASAMFACMILAFTYYSDLPNRALELGLISAVCVTIKTSGLLIVFFLLFVAEQLYQRYSCEKSEYDKKMLHYRILERGTLPLKPKIDLLPYVLLIGLPLFAFAIWKIHGWITFSLNNISGGKHSGSISALSSTMGSGTERFEKAIIILPYFFNMNRNRAILPVICMLFLTARKKHQEDIQNASNGTQKMLSYAVITATFTLVYEISLLLMYVFSMSLHELRSSADSYYRYNRTIVAVLSGISLFLSIHEWESLGKKRPSVISILLIVSGVLMTGYGMDFKINDMPEISALVEKYPDYASMERVMESESISDEDVVLIQCQNDYRSPSNGANYYLYPCTDFTVVFDDKSREKALQEKEYTLVINLYEGTIQNQTGKKTIDEYVDAIR